MKVEQTVLVWELLHTRHYDRSNPTCPWCQLEDLERQCQT